VPRIRRRPGLWLALALIIGAAALLVPRVSYTPASQTSAAPAACRGVRAATIPAVGFITNPSRTQGGHLWWRPAGGGVCIGTVIGWVQYNTTATKTWRVIVYSGAHPHGQVVAQRTFTLGQGWYWWSFGVHRVFAGLSAVCFTADDSFGVACLHFSSPAA
jgi:hypothetical protein